MKLSDLKKIIKESIATQLELTPKPKLERDDIGTIYVCIKPQGGETTEQLVIPTTVMEYNTKMNGKETHAIVNDENRAKRIAERLRRGKVQELCSLKNQEIKQVDEQIKKHKALKGALGHYHKLSGSELDESSKQKDKGYDIKISELEKQKGQLLTDLEILKQGKLPKNSTIQHQVVNENVDSPVKSLTDKLNDAIMECNAVLQKYYFETDFSEDLRDMLVKKMEIELDPIVKQKEEEKIAKQTAVNQNPNPTQNPPVTQQKQVVAEIKKKK